AILLERIGPLLLRLERRTRAQLRADDVGALLLFDLAQCLCNFGRVRANTSSLLERAPCPGVVRVRERAEAARHRARECIACEPRFDARYALWRARRFGIERKRLAKQIERLL